MFLWYWKHRWEFLYHNTGIGSQQTPSTGRLPSWTNFFLVHQFVFLRCTLTYLLSSLPFFLLIDARSRSGPSKSSWNRFAFTSENHSPVTNFFFFSSLMEPCIRLKVSASITHQKDLQSFDFPWAIFVICPWLHLSDTTKDPEILLCNHKSQTSIKTAADIFFIWNGNSTL